MAARRTVWGEQYVAARGKPTYRDELVLWRNSVEPKISGEAIGEAIDVQRDAISKVETGKNKMYLDDYIMVVRYFTNVPTYKAIAVSVIPTDHPALALSHHFRRRAIPKILLDDYLSCMLFTAEDLPSDHPGVLLARYLNFSVRTRVRI